MPRKRKADECTQDRRPLPVHVRWMITSDLSQVQAIEVASFDHPWTHLDFMRCIAQSNVIGVVAEAGERVCGFILYDLHQDRFGLFNFAVHPDFRRRGVGRQMLAKLVDKLNCYQRSRLRLEVRETNLAAQLFFAAQDLRATAVLPDFFDNGETAYRFEYLHPLPADVPQFGGRARIGF